MIEKLNAYDKLITQINSNIKGLKVYPKILSEDKNHKFHPVFEKMLYNALSVSDLIIGLKFLDLSVHLQNQIESIYFSKIIALNSYEMIIESQRFTGSKDVKHIFLDVSNSELNNRLKEIKKDLNQAKINQKYLKKIRNNIVAHKDENPFNQILATQKLEFEKIYNIGNELFKTHLKLFMLFMDLLQEFSNKNPTLNK